MTTDILVSLHGRKIGLSAADQLVINRNDGSQMVLDETTLAMKSASTLVTMGNSLSALAGYPITPSLPSSTGTLTPILDYSWQPWALGFLGQKLQWLANVAVSGKNILDQYALIDTYVAPLAPTYVSFMEGRNSMVPVANGGGGRSLAQASADTLLVVQKLIGYGIQVILMTHPTATAAPAASGLTVLQWNLQLMQYNKYCRSIAIAMPGVILVDMEAATIDPLSATCAPKTNYIRSGNDPHLTAKGNRAMGKAFSDVMTPRLQVGSGPYRATSNYDNVINGSTAVTPLKALNSNPLFQGSGGTASGGATGTVAATCAAGMASGTATNVASLVARADGFGNDQVLTVSAVNGATPNAFVRCSSSEAIAFPVTNDYLFAIANVNLTAMTDVIGMEMALNWQISASPNTLFSNYGMQKSATVLADYDQTDLTDFWMITPITQFPVSAAGTLNARFNVYFGATNTGAAVLKIGRLNFVDLGQQPLLSY